MAFNFLKNSEPENRGKIISFLNQKGGVGKTTMAFNTAHALAQKGLKVLCLDMDPQANLSLLFDVDLQKNPGSHLHHLLINSVRELKSLHVPAVFTDVLVEKRGVDLLPSGQELSGFELTVAAVNTPRQLVLKRFIEKNSLLKLYDYILVDGPPTLGLLVINILCASHGILVPFKPDDFSRKGLRYLYQMLEEVADMGITDPPQILAHIPNLVDLRRKQEGVDLEGITSELKQEFGADSMLDPFFNRALLSKCQAQKKSVFDYKSQEFEGLQHQFGKMAQIIEEWGHEQTNQ